MTVGRISLFLTLPSENQDLTLSFPDNEHPTTLRSVNHSSGVAIHFFCVLNRNLDTDGRFGPVQSLDDI